MRGGPGGGTGAQLLKKGDASSEEQAKEWEKKVHELLEGGAIAVQAGDVVAGGCGTVGSLWGFVAHCGHA